MVKKAVTSDSLPDYQLGYEQVADHVVFYTKDAQKTCREFGRMTL
jgi:hypothetical protein